VLVFVAQDHLVQQPVAHPAIVDYLEHSCPYVAQIAPRRVWPKQLDVTAQRARRLERVVGGREVLVQERPLAVAVREP
jgi:hypothetical protein